MKRRRFIKLIVTTCLTASPFGRLLAHTTLQTPHPVGTPQFDADIKDYLHKMQNFDQTHQGDIFIAPEDQTVFNTSLKRLKRIQRLVGYGNFCLLDFDNALKTARAYARVGAFTREELAFLESIFYGNGASYGFYGKKPLDNITDCIRTDKVVKIKYSGNYLYRGPALETYHQIKKDIGKDAVLTSGIRSITKQFLLFLAKVKNSGGNLSRASRSLAPPGYSFHGIGDFDVGQYNYGAANFTARFTESSVYAKLEDLGYINLRYPDKNRLGVRFEPWHIRVG